MPSEAELLAQAPPGGGRHVGAVHPPAVPEHITETPGDVPGGREREREDGGPAHEEESAAAFGPGLEGEVL